MRLYVQNRARWRRTVSIVGLLLWAVVLFRVLGRGYTLHLDVDNMILTTSLMLMVYVLTMPKEGR